MATNQNQQKKGRSTRKPDTPDRFVMEWVRVMNAPRLGPLKNLSDLIRCMNPKLTIFR
jgi:hypothetical protein